ncbi:hypothetical protein LTR99_000619 [Exophiala xenobiotica]|uniref:DUF5671 domain-containing protein n=1 Tax=Vermiconidia calcicola TaxID=1690605 RepID=A0AAV9QJQ5_9PEZI|nr:hypothetical protein LTR92_002964 [Exophiala xenobiotica]KAK5543558.1 hypothetical protein LTR25_001172 [Vermiconidia calcicola]KAK5548221.1 hypothetical protein LTR23_001930 [Chaetothyriales sp. CCFEE 6169]KAK5213398.1 hypothetical protein LTR41_000977 [Exophiala xenobiotica]KAK5231074.1 hypothetical protein LTR72_000254 [Exophiala xenobiotica]
MPCPWSRRCRAAVDNVPDTLPSPTLAPDMEDWKKIRKYHLRNMRKQVRQVVLLMALMEAIRVGPIQLVYEGKHGYPAAGEDDFGIAHAVGYFVSWLYLCAFTVVFVPFFSWWLPEMGSGDPEKPSTADKAVKVLTQLNLVLLPMSIGIGLLTYAYHAICAFIYVDSRPKDSKRLPKNTRKNWLIRLSMLLGIAMSTAGGYGAFNILAAWDLAHVKPIEYAIIVVPVQINLGMLFGTIAQFKMEKRLARKEAIKLASVKHEAASTDEKAGLLQEV